MLTCASHAAIGVFDSGVGGLSIAAAIRQLLPHENIIYVADSANAPYGGKPEQMVLQRCQAIVEFLMAQQVKLIVVACNTATLTCIAKLRALYPIEFVGVEPGIKPALNASQTGTIGVLATHNTIKSQQYQQLVARLKTQNTVLSQACHGLVEKIEAGEFDSPATQTLIKQYVLPLITQGADQIVLGCTHYGFLSRQIRGIAGENTQLVNTSDAIARQTLAVLTRNEMLNSSQPQGQTKLFSSRCNPDFLAVSKLLWPNEIQQAHEFPH
ncbi:MAG: glutamate racemase [Aliiglaciecola sp.]|uniref:glutamate racemase n=1 Tax=Aliiglaciecola sp. TaxID=1872441 RepID=UPI003299116F